MAQIKLDADGNPIRKIKLDADGKPIRKIKLDADGKPVKHKKHKDGEDAAPATEAVDIPTAAATETTVSEETAEGSTSASDEAIEASSGKKIPKQALIGGIAAACLVLASVGGVLAYNMISGSKAEVVVEETTVAPTTEAQTETEKETETDGPEEVIVEVPDFVDCKVTGESVEKDLTMYIRNPDGKKLTGNKFQVLLVSSSNKSKVDEAVKAVKEINAEIDKAKEEAEKNATSTDSANASTATPVLTSSTASSGKTSTTESTTEAVTEEALEEYVSTDKVTYISSITGEELTDVERLLIKKQEAYDEYAKTLESIKGTIYTDDDGDGVIDIDKIDSGTYYAAFVPSDSYIPATYTSKLVVKDKLEYKAVEEIEDKTVSEAAAGDTQEKNVTVEEQLVDTVTYVNTSTKTTPVAAAATASFVAATGASNGVHVTTTKKEATTEPSSESTTTSTESSSEETESSSSSEATSAKVSSSLMLAALTPTKTIRTQTSSTGEADNVTLSVDRTTIYQTADGTNSSLKATVTSSIENLSYTLYVDDTAASGATIKASDYSGGTHTLKIAGTDINGDAWSVSVGFTVVAGSTALTDASGTALFLDTAGSSPAKVSDYKDGIALYKVVQTTTYYGWQRIDGSSYYFDENGNKVTGEQVIGGAKYNFSNDGVLLSSGLGIDVSKWQGNINWKQVSNAVSFAIIRCGIRGTSGELAIDSKAVTNITNAKANGVKVGLYFYTRAQTEAQAVEEASLAVSIANQCGGINLPIYIDVEDSTISGLSNAQRDAIVMAFCNTVKNSGYSAGVYANKNWMTNKLSAKSYSGISIWVAQYNSSCTYTGTYKMWQYSSSGTVPGISGNVDMDLMY